MSLESLCAKVQDCNRCILFRERTRVVFGAGPPESRVMLVGEAPGRDEDAQGLPFVGRAGRMLDNYLCLASLSREKAYVTNAVKCRPPLNRAPKSAELDACRKYLLEQISLISPAVIVPLGRVPLLALLRAAGTSGDFADTRGRPTTIRLSGKPRVLFPVFHPAASLHNPLRRSQVEDSYRALGAYLATDTVI